MKIIVHYPEERIRSTMGVDTDDSDALWESSSQSCVDLAGLYFGTETIWPRPAQNNVLDPMAMKR